MGIMVWSLLRVLQDLFIASTICSPVAPVLIRVSLLLPFGLKTGPPEAQRKKGNRGLRQNLAEPLNLKP